MSGLEYTVKNGHVSTLIDRRLVNINDLNFQDTDVIKLIKESEGEVSGDTITAPLKVGAGH